MLTTVTTHLSPDNKSKERIYSRTIEEHEQQATYHKDSFYLPVSNKENSMDNGMLPDIFENISTLDVICKDMNQSGIHLPEECVNNEMNMSVNKTLEGKTPTVPEFVTNTSFQEMPEGITNNSIRKPRPGVLELAEEIPNQLPLATPTNFSVNKKLKSMKNCCRTPHLKRQSHVRYVESEININWYFTSHA